MSDIIIGSDIAAPPAGQLTKVEILQRDKPVRVLDGWKDISVNVDWELNPTAYALAAATGGVWEIQIHAESIGGGPEGRLHNGSLANSAGVYDAATAMFKFHYSGIVGRPTLTEHGPTDAPGPISGVYQLVGTLFLDGQAPFFDLVGFEEMKLVMNEPLN